MAETGIVKSMMDSGDVVLIDAVDYPLVSHGGS